MVSLSQAVQLVNTLNGYSQGELTTTWTGCARSGRVSGSSGANETIWGVLVKKDYVDKMYLGETRRTQTDMVVVRIRRSTMGSALALRCTAEAIDT